MNGSSSFSREGKEVQTPNTVDVISKRNQQASDLGIRYFQSQIDSVVKNVSGGARGHWNNKEGGKLRAMIMEGKKFEEYIANHGFYPDTVKKELLQICVLYELSARFGRTSLAFAEGKKPIDSKKFTEMQQVSIIRMATVAHAFANELAKRPGIGLENAWNTLLNDPSFMRFLSSLEDPGSSTREANIRKKYGLSTDPMERQVHIEAAHLFVAEQAQQAGFSQNSIATSARVLGVGYKPPKTFKSPVPSSVTRLTEASVLSELERERKKREAELRKKLAEREKLAKSDQSKPKPKEKKA